MSSAPTRQRRAAGGGGGSLSGASGSCSCRPEATGHGRRRRILGRRVVIFPLSTAASPVGLGLGSTQTLLLRWWAPPMVTYGYRSPGHGTTAEEKSFAQLLPTLMMRRRPWAPLTFLEGIITVEVEGSQHGKQKFTYANMTE